MAKYMIKQLEKHLSRKFSIQMDESTATNNEAVLMAYIRYIDNNEFTQEILFCEALKTTIAIKQLQNLFRQSSNINEKFYIF